jgi:RNA polymerase primary sigma factor
MISGAVDSLPEAERNVIRLRFGLGGVEPLNLRQTGQELGITLGKARELEQQGLSRLAQSSGLDELRRAA